MCPKQTMKKRDVENSVWEIWRKWEFMFYLFKKVLKFWPSKLIANDNIAVNNIASAYETWFEPEFKENIISHEESKIERD